MEMLMEIGMTTFCYTSVEVSADLPYLLFNSNK